ncbi:cell division protein FtsQ/DivIB [Bacillaceae bacterium IKA-2]|jgi:cell division protein FtsQ|nr:cell division protein FtsQ/DivIB [Bacillaceae bacterium IKA-2]
MDQKKVITLEDRIPKLKSERKQRANRALILYLSIFFLLLLTVIYFQSSLSDVKVIKIEGNRYLTDEEIVRASKLTDKTSFWGVNKQEIKAEITSLTQISGVSINRKFPYTVIINVEEYTRVAYLVTDGKFSPILESGKLLATDTVTGFPTDAPLLMGWSNGSELAEMAAELSKLPEGLIHRISEIYFTPEELDPLRITLYMNDGFQVSSTIRHFSEKIAPYSAIVSELDPHNKGIIHMKINPYFELFDPEEEQEIESEG